MAAYDIFESEGPDLEYEGLVMLVCTDGLDGESMGESKGACAERSR